jgi:hypothetical protein
MYKKMTVDEAMTEIGHNLRATFDSMLRELVSFANEPGLDESTLKSRQEAARRAIPILKTGACDMINVLTALRAEVCEPASDPSLEDTVEMPLVDG